MNIINIIALDYPESWGTYFQDPASTWMYAIRDLHDRIVFYMIILQQVVQVYQVSALNNKDHQANLHHGNRIEQIWTITPAIILWLIGIPSQKLQYIMDCQLYPELSVKACGSQWFWSYQFTDYSGTDQEQNYDSYQIPESDLETGDLRNLAVDNYQVLPINTSIRMQVTSNDVIHSFAIPSQAMKQDALPGRQNSTGLIINRPGTYYGQCSELCGTGHGFMPIGQIGCNQDSYLLWLKNQD